MKSQLILASTSPYRAELLTKLQVPFEQISPDCDETPFSNESAKSLVLRLAIDKADSIARKHPEAFVIGSDQVADLKGQILGKPGTHKTATEQLLALSGNTLVFYTGLAVIRQSTNQRHSCVVPTQVVFRDLTEEKISRYLTLDQPYNCAGSFKSESLGCTLVESMNSDDPAALIGLPLIKLSQYLDQMGLPIA